MQTVHINTSIDYVTHCALFVYFHFPNAPFSVAFLFPMCKPTGTLHKAFLNSSMCSVFTHLQVKLTRVVSVLLSSDDNYISMVS